MQITDLLKPESIALHRAIPDKGAAIHQLAALMCCAQNITDAAAFEQAVRQREEQTPTEVGGGIAIPHAKCDAVTTPGLAALTVEPGLPSATGGEPVRLLFLIAAPEHADALHVQILSQLATLLMDPVLPGKLMQADTPEAFLDIIAAWERSRAPRAPVQPTTYKLLAVTGCPLGLAHTFLAAEALQNAAAEMEVRLKVETNGADGVKNRLTPEEITAASCIIVAADKQVEMARFAGKPVLTVPVGAAVRSPRALLEEALSGTVPRLPEQDERPSAQMLAPEKTGRWLHHGYTHLMNGVSHMIPFLTGGGLLIALGLLLAHLGAGRDLTWTLQTLGKIAIGLMYPVLAGYIASSMAGEAALVPAMVGGVLAQQGATLALQQYWTSSGFVGALAAGFMAGLIARLLQWGGKRLPKQLDPIKNTLLFPALAMGLVGVFMVYWVNPPLSLFNGMVYQFLSGMSGVNRVVLGAVLGALMALDYGGPINKAAYLFGTIAIVNDQFDIMASVMMGGMVPPMAVALCCLLFPHCFTDDERRTAPQNLLLGASFVTEGALPFALKDPLRVVPACAMGSGVAGALSMVFRCGCPAPHGGLFLLPVVEHPLLYIVTLAAGALVGALVMGHLKKLRPAVKEHS